MLEAKWDESRGFEREELLRLKKKTPFSMDVIFLFFKVTGRE
jgi:hypothetical protein